MTLGILHRSFREHPHVLERGDREEASVDVAARIHVHVREFAEQLAREFVRVEGIWAKSPSKGSLISAYSAGKNPRLANE